MYSYCIHAPMKLFLTTLTLYQSVICSFWKFNMPQGHFHGNIQLYHNFNGYMVFCILFYSLSLSAFRSQGFFVCLFFIKHSAVINILWMYHWDKPRDVELSGQRQLTFSNCSLENLFYFLLSSVAYEGIWFPTPLPTLEIISLVLIFACLLGEQWDLILSCGSVLYNISLNICLPFI